MRSRSETIEALVNPGIIAVIRLPKSEWVLPVCEALLAGGVTALEITLTTPGALDAIRRARETLPANAVVGAGTVVTVDQADQALEAGAEFLVSPIMRPAIVERAHAPNQDCPVMLGAYTPSEAQAAHEAGADFVKLFPADGLGPGYVKALRAPLPHLRIVPTGGVDLETAAAFLQAGCVALGVGSSLLRRDLLEGGNWSELTRLAGDYVRIVREERGGN